MIPRGGIPEGLIESIISLRYRNKQYPAPAQSYQEWFGRVAKAGYGLDFGTLSRATSLANQAVLGGRSFSELPPSSTLPLSQIPVNPDLFGPDRQGNRYQYHVRTRIVDSTTGRQKWLSHFIRSGRNLTSLQVMQEAESRLAEKFEKYPVRGASPVFEDWFISAVEIVSVQRRF